MSSSSSTSNDQREALLQVDRTSSDSRQLETNVKMISWVGKSPDDEAHVVKREEQEVFDQETDDEGAAYDDATSEVKEEAFM